MKSYTRKKESRPAKNRSGEADVGLVLGAGLLGLIAILVLLAMIAAMVAAMFKAMAEMVETSCDFLYSMRWFLLIVIVGTGVLYDRHATQNERRSKWQQRFDREDAVRQETVDAEREERKASREERRQKREEKRLREEEYLQVADAIAKAQADVDEHYDAFLCTVSNDYALDRFSADKNHAFLACDSLEDVAASKAKMLLKVDRAVCKHKLDRYCTLLRNQYAHNSSVIDCRYPPFRQWLKARLAKMKSIHRTDHPASASRRIDEMYDTLTEKLTEVRDRAEHDLEPLLAAERKKQQATSERAEREKHEQNVRAEFRRQVEVETAEHGYTDTEKAAEADYRYQQWLRRQASNNDALTAADCFHDSPNASDTQRGSSGNRYASAGHSV